VSIPIITNRVPPAGSILGVQDALRFSAKDQDLQVLRNTINFYVGTGATFWEGGYLPEDHENIDFTFRALSGAPEIYAERSIEPGGELRISKPNPNTNQEAMYEFGGLQAPATLFDPLMVEFTLKMALADLTFLSEYAGVTFILRANNSGVGVRFRYVPAAVDKYRVHLFDANFSSNVSKASVIHDWDQGMAQTYKLLWHPAKDLVRLYVSSGQDNDDRDLLLIDTTVSAFGPLFEEEKPPVQPTALFGHGWPVQTSISYWSNVYLYNFIHSPVLDGIFRGENVGFILTDEVVRYDGMVVPSKAPRPWNAIPSSFSDVGGKDSIAADGTLEMTRTDKTKSFGYYRVEPKIAIEPCIVDFAVSGTLLSKPDQVASSTGMEVYIDNGVKQARFALLNISGVQHVGFLRTDLNKDLGTSYSTDQTGWTNPFPYRLIMDPSGICSLRRLESTDEGISETVIGDLEYSLMPGTEFPGPGIGFLHNANVVEALAVMRMKYLRYYPNARLMDGVELPQPPWVSNGVGSSTPDPLILNDTTFANKWYYSMSEPTMDSENGTFLEFRARVESYETEDQGVGPIRQLTGVGVSLDDGTYQHLLMFADAGPPLGKIIFLAVSDDYNENLLDIRAGASSVAGTYAQVDWTKFHLYRMERTVGARLQLFIDNEDAPAIDLDQFSFSPPSTWGTKEVRFGSLIDTVKTQSTWIHLRHGVSSGFDVSGYPVLTDQEVLQRFNQAVNVIVEAGT